MHIGLNPRTDLPLAAASTDTASQPMPQVEQAAHEILDAWVGKLKHITLPTAPEEVNEVDANGCNVQLLAAVCANDVPGVYSLVLQRAIDFGSRVAAFATSLEMVTALQSAVTVSTTSMSTAATGLTSTHSTTSTQTVGAMHTTTTSTTTGVLALVPSSAAAGSSSSQKLQ